MEGSTWSSGGVAQRRHNDERERKKKKERERERLIMKAKCKDVCGLGLVIPGAKNPRSTGCLLSRWCSGGRALHPTATIWDDLSFVCYGTCQPFAAFCPSLPPSLPPFTCAPDSLFVCCGRVIWRGCHREAGGYLCSGPCSGGERESKKERKREMKSTKKTYFYK